MTKVMIIHPGHGHSTSDTYDGLCVGLAMCGMDVVPIAWDQMLRPLSVMVTAAIEHGKLNDAQGEHMHQFASYLASGDVVAMAVDEDVDAVLVVNGLLFPPSRATVLRKLGIPVACYGTESPYFDRAEREIAPHYTHWFTQERSAVARFQALGVPSFYLPMAYNPQTHHTSPVDADKRCDVTFVGGGFPERRTLLDGVCWDGIDRTVHGTLWQLDMEQERGKNDFGRGARYTEGAIPNDMTSAWHRSATIALNIHRQMTYVENNAPLACGAAESLGPRAYEIPACGGFMLCDDERPEIYEVYGGTAATFRAWDSTSLEREIRWWLAHDDARERTRAAQAAAAAPHHWGARARTILETIL